MTKTANPKCSRCGKLFDAEASASRPFCSRRCQQLDLGQWLDEEMALPHDAGRSTAEGFEVDETGHVISGDGESF